MIVELRGARSEKEKALGARRWALVADAARRPSLTSASRLAPRAFRSAITLMEVLISMFVLLFGLMGVAAIFPVGNYYVVEGEKYDQGSILAQNAFEELQARGMLRPEAWLYSSDELGPLQVIDPNTGQFSVAAADGPGHAFVIDPIGAPNSPEVHFPFAAHEPPVPNNNPWLPLIPGDVWPVRRLTLPIPDPNNPGGYQPMTTPVAEVIFRLRDDLAVSLPERDDAPGIQRWNVDGAGNLLTRQYQGNFSWLATIVPQTTEALLGLQPAVRKGHLYDVSVVVFYKRDTTPSAESERLIQAEMLSNGEIAIYATGSNAIPIVDSAVKEIKAGDWIAVMGVNQTTGLFMLKWYRLLSLDDETNTVDLSSSTEQGRHAMLTGPDWPLQAGSGRNLRAAILPGVASVVTRAMTLEKESLWSGN